jgi:SAM-dependent methyltransferase
MSILVSLLRDIFSKKTTSDEIKSIQLLLSADETSHASKKKVLNVGGNNKLIELPPQYQEWEHILLDIDPRGEPDIVCDARELTHLPRSQFDAVYCSHNLEHYHRHDAVKVLSGFLHVLKEDGFAHIRVPDMGELMRIVVRNNLDIDDFLYESPAGPITVRDVIYGYAEEIERSGNDFFAHKTGFTQNSLVVILNGCGFPYVYSNPGNLEVLAYAFKNKPSEFAIKLLDLEKIASYRVN